MWIIRAVVIAAVLATLAFNATYAYSRGSTWTEQATLIAVALIIDAAKSTFLAGAGLLRDRRHYLAAVILFLLWWPAFALSTWAGFANITTWREASSSTKAAGADTRVRAKARYDRAQKQIELITTAPQYFESSGCTLRRSNAMQSFCTRFDQATAELKAADAALTVAPAGKADPETALLVDVSGWQHGTIEFLIAFIPSLFVELVAALGAYAISRPAPTSRTPPVPPAAGTAVGPVLRAGREVASPKPENPPQALPKAAETPPPRAPGAALVLRPGKS